MQYFARSGALVGFPELVRTYGEHSLAWALICNLAALKTVCSFLHQC